MHIYSIIGRTLQPEHPERGGPIASVLECWSAGNDREDGMASVSSVVVLSSGWMRDDDITGLVR